MHRTSATLQLVLSLLAALALFASALAFAAFGAVQFLFPQQDLDPASSFLWAGSLAFVGLLVLPSAWFSLQDLRGRPARWSSDLKWVTGLSLTLLLLVLPIVLLLGNWVSSNPHVAWLLLPPLHILAVFIPIFWIGSLALRRLPLGSPRRFWGVFAAALTIGPFSILVVELFAMIVATGAALLILSSQPGVAEQLDRLFRTLQYALPDQRALENILKPLVSNPAPVLAVVSFVAVIVPLIEETLKPAALWLLRGRNLAPEEGFALGALSGAAYALFESLFLATTGQGWSVVVIARIGTAALHILTAALTGWGLALAWGQKKYLRLGLQYGLAVLLHAAWNALTAMNTAAVLLPPGTNNPASSLIQTVAKMAPYGLLAIFLACFATLGFLNRRLAASVELASAPHSALSGDLDPDSSSDLKVEPNGTDSVSD